MLSHSFENVGSQLAVTENSETVLFLLGGSVQDGGRVSVEI